MPTPDPRRLHRRTLLKTMAGAASLWGLSGCARFTPNLLQSKDNNLEADRAATQRAAERANELAVCLPDFINQIDPVHVTSLTEYHLRFAIYEGLVWIDASLTPQPQLALAWESNQDGTQWTFNLRQDVLFHHGKPCTAQDVVYSFERILDPATRSPIRTILAFIDRVEPLNDYTVRFHLKETSFDLPTLLGEPQTGIVPKDLDSDMLAEKPVGTGPFRLVELRPNQHVLLERNPDYWGEGEPQVDRLRLLLLPSAADRVEALLSGEADLIAQVSSDSLALLQGRGGINVQVIPSGAYQTIIMQATKQPFTDVRVRRALKYCVDRPAMLASVLNGLGEVGNDQPIAPVSPFYAGLPAPTQDIEQAKALLAEAGYGQGLSLSLVTVSSQGSMVQMAQAFKEMAKPAGVDVTVITVPPDVYLTDYWRKSAFHTGSWAFRSSIDQTLMLAYHTSADWNESLWGTTELDRLIEEARRESNLARRIELYTEIQSTIMEDGAVIIPYFRSEITAARSRVRGLALHPSGWQDYHKLSISG